MTIDKIYLQLAKALVNDCERWISLSPEGPFKENRKEIVARLRPLIQAYENDDNIGVRKAIAEAIVNEFTT